LVIFSFQKIKDSLFGEGLFFGTIIPKSAEIKNFAKKFRLFKCSESYQGIGMKSKLSTNNNVQNQ